MRICILCRSYVGGFKSFLDNLACLLMKKGIRLDVLNLGDSDVNVQGVNLIDKKPIERGAARTFKENAFLFKCSLMRLVKKAWSAVFKNNRRIQRVAALYSSQFFCAKTIMKQRTLLDLTEYDCVISSEEIYCNYFLSYSVLAKRKVCYIHPDYKMAGFDRGIDEFFLKDVDAICAVSLANAETLRRSMPLLESKIHGIPNPIDVESVVGKSNAPCETVFDRKQKNLVTVCRLDNSSKALDRLVEVASELKKENIDFCWRIVGDGPYKETLSGLIEKNGLTEEVLLVGYMSNPMPIVKNSDLFVLQSYYEGYPISVCEALIVGVPAFVTDFPAAKELIESGKNGVIAENEKADISRKLLDLLSDVDALARMKEHLKSLDKRVFSNLDRFMDVIGG